MTIAEIAQRARVTVGFAVKELSRITGRTLASTPCSPRCADESTPPTINSRS